MSEAQRRDADTALNRRELRATRDLAIRALYSAGLSSGEISRLFFADVRSFPSGKVSVRLRGAGAPRYVVLDGRPANRVARHFESLAATDRTHPAFAGRVAGAPLTSRAVLLVLRDPNDQIDRRER